MTLYARLKYSITCCAGYLVAHLLRKYVTMLDFLTSLEQRMCPGTFLRLRRSLATSTLYAAVRIPAERFLCNGNEISHYTRKPRPVKGRGNISETTCYCILTYDLYAPVVTRRIRQNLLIFDLSACNSEVIFNHLLLAPVLHRHRLALPFTNDLLSSS